MKIRRQDELMLYFLFSFFIIPRERASYAGA